VRPAGSLSSSLGNERRIQPSWTILQLKENLYPVLGIAANYQVLQGSDGRVFGPDDALVGQVLYDGQDLFVQDSNPFKTTLNEAAVPKYQIDDQAYEARPENFRKFRRNLERVDPGRHFQRMTQTKQEKQEALLAAVKSLSLGDRCEVIGGRRGSIAYLGEVAGRKPGPWVGIRLDEPTGANDSGSYFTAPPNSSLWQRPTKIKAGDFPERDPFDDDDSDGEM
jgi:tubulin-specific chaperone B